MVFLSKVMPGLLWGRKAILDWVVQELGRWVGTSINYTCF
jgi:hypothetical protein